MVVSTLDMRVLEINSVALGIPLRLLMEAAGKSVADEVCRRVRQGGAGRVCVLAGKGGNGGDGLVAARYLASRGFKVDVVLSHDPSLIEHPDTVFNYRVASSMNAVRINVFEEGLTLDGFDVLIDALLGTGVKGELKGSIRRMVEEANRVEAELKVAVDTPTGLNPDTGEVHGVAFRADVTVTFHDVKPGLLKRRDITGEVVVANIGIPPEAWIYVGPGDVQVLVPKRPREAHKGSMGRVLVVGGSNRFTGAPALSALASLASGADLAFIFAPEEVRGIIASYSPELITIPYETPFLKPPVLNKLYETIDKVRPHVLVVGPGLGDEPETLAAVVDIVNNSVDKNIPMVIDADALKTINKEVIELKGKAVVTPHRGEFQKISGVNLSGDPLKDLDLVKQLAKQIQAVVLLKAPVDIVSDGTRVKLNRTGNPYMSIGGTGDVLTGIVATLIAQTKDLFVSACVAAYLNGLAGDYLLHRGQHVSPLRLVEALPIVMKKPLEHHVEIYSNGRL